MKINYLELKNYRKFAHAQLELGDGVIGIVGKNGVGKSTLVESIAWALFGNRKEIDRGEKKSIRRSGASQREPTSVKLEFSYGGDEFVVSREMTGKSLSIDASLKINGKTVATGATEVTQEIERKLGMDYKSFFVSVFARQKDLAALSSLPDSQRRDTVVRMLGIDRLDDIIKEIGTDNRYQRGRVDDLRMMTLGDDGKSKKDALNIRKNELEKIKEASDKKIESLRKQQSELIEKEKKLDSRTDEINSRLKELSAIENQIKLTKASLNSKKDELERIRRDLEEAKNAKKSVEKQSAIEKEIAELKKKYEELQKRKRDFERFMEMKKQLDEMRKEAQAVEKDIDSQIMSKERLSEEIKKLDGIKKDRIETEEELSGAKQRQSELNERIKNSKNQLKTDRDHLTQIDKLGPDSQCPTCERPLGKHYEGLTAKLSESVESVERELESLEKFKSEAESTISDRKRKLEALDRKLDILSGKERECAQLEKGIELNRNEMNRTKDKIANLEKETKEVSQIEFSASELEKLSSSIDFRTQERDRLLVLTAVADKIDEFESSERKTGSEIKDLETALEKFKYDSTEAELLETSLEEAEKRAAELREKSNELYESILKFTESRESSASERASIEKEIASIGASESKVKDIEDELRYMAKLDEIMKSFRNNLISRIIPTLSQIASDLLGQLTDGRYERLTLDERYNIFIDDGGESHVLDRFSGGESDLANLCLRLAISRVIAERTLTEGINLLVLDEIFGSQDAARKRNLLLSFNSLSSQFRQIILITHIDDVRDQLSNLLEVYEDEQGISHLRHSA